MAVQLDLEFEQVVKLIDQLSSQQQQVLLQHLSENATERTLTKDEKKALYHASIMSVPVSNAPSIRREDWYNDDGR